MAEQSEKKCPGEITNQRISFSDFIGENSQLHPLLKYNGYSTTEKWLTFIWMTTPRFTRFLPALYAEQNVVKA